MLWNNPDYPVLKKIHLIRDPDLYLAHNVGDFLTDVSKIEYPWYKRFPFVFDKIFDTAYVVINNVGISNYKHKDFVFPDWFWIHDETGKDLIRWDNYHDLTPNIVSYEEAQLKQGLQDEDWVYEVLFSYHINYKWGHIVDVNKYYSRPEPEKESLFDKARRLLEEKLVPEPTSS